MKNYLLQLFIKPIVIASTLLFWSQSQAAIFWVGESAQCNQSNHYDTMNLAILQTLINGSENDEIRLTNTVDYIGNGAGDYVLDNFNSGGAGELTITGGYNNCNGSITGETEIGGGTDTVLEISGGSIIELNNLNLINSNDHGIDISESSSVHLNNVDVDNNTESGIDMIEGSYLQVDSASVIKNNGYIGGLEQSRGGGIDCIGENSEVVFSGLLLNNKARYGGNLYLSNQCTVTLNGGARIQGSGDGTNNAFTGGGIYVASELLANGGANRIFITDHSAIEGGGVFVTSSGRATLINTFIGRNNAPDGGSGLYAQFGGTSEVQVVMDRAATCPFIISCSEFEDNDYSHSVVYVKQSIVEIKRTLFDRNTLVPDNRATRDIRGTISLTGLTYTTQLGRLRLSYVNMISNESINLMAVDTSSSTNVAHLTAVLNSYNGNDSFAWANSGNLRLENSIWQDTQGGNNIGASVSGKCNLVDVIGDWPNGSYTVGTADFINPAGGDSRQLSSSDGVDMCQDDTMLWTTNRDIEYQFAPVNEFTNPQGLPGEGGIYDAGFDEVYDNIGEDKFLLTVQKEGSGSGTVVSTPVGIACGNDCTEVFYHNTLVTLFANASTGSDFTGWSSCPLPNGNQCLITITESDTVYAEFQPDDLIFEDGFE